jgi:uncharacterized protein YajQ (UPF0234 family)
MFTHLRTLIDALVARADTSEIAEALGSFEKEIEARFVKLESAAKVEVGKVEKEAKKVEGDVVGEVKKVVGVVEPHLIKVEPK